VLCFVDGDWPLFRPPSSFRGVRLEGSRSIRSLLTARRFWMRPWSVVSPGSWQPGYRRN